MNEVYELLISAIQQFRSNAANYSPQQIAKISSILEGAVSFLEQQPGPEISAVKPSGTELLWYLSNGNPDVFVNYLNSVPDPALNQLVRNPLQLRSIVEDLSERFPSEGPEVIQNVEKAPINSSNIWGFSYDPRNQKLLVRFQGDGIYQYDQVPEYIFRIFQSGAIPAKTKGSNQYGSWWVGKNPSLGASLYQLIKNGGYAYQKLS